MPWLEFDTLHIIRKEVTISTSCSLLYSDHHCPHYEPPLNGVLTCERLLHNRFCTVTCNDNYEFAREPDVSYFCANIDNTMLMEWQPPPLGNKELSMPWPDCSSR